MADDKQPRPHWWNAAHDLSWEKVKGALVADWHKMTEGAQKLEKTLQERALAFGHGARDAYAKFGVWTADLEKELRADWEKTHKDASANWDKVKDAVKHGWERTKKS
jgi:hypothetical protein